MDRQIKVKEDYIARLEESRRTGSGNDAKLDHDIENAYQQIALLKIREFMNLAI